MYRVSCLHRLTALALLIAVFVVIPVADAALCGEEVQSSHLSLSVDEDHNSDETSLPDFLQDHCEHGHCHHTTACVAISIAGADLRWRQAHIWPDYDAAVSFTPEGLKRPPKA